VRGAAALVLLALAVGLAAIVAVLLLRAEEPRVPETAPAPETRPPPDEVPPEEPDAVSAPGVRVEVREEAVVVVNEAGEWTVLTACLGGGGETVGPGYVSRLVAPDGSVVLDDRGPPEPLNDPGYGGLGAFAWHHARGRPGALRLARDNAWEVSGRICAEHNGGFGVAAARLLDPPAHGEGEPFVSFAVDVELSDKWTHPAPLMTVRYRYRAYPDVLRVWVAVRELCPGGRCGSTRELAFLKEPKLAAGLRAGDGALPHTRAAVFDAAGELRCLYVSGGPAEGPVLDTGQCAHPDRARVRFDAGSDTSGSGGGCERILCVDVVAQAYPTVGGDVVPGAGAAPWAGSSGGFDAWAVAAARRPAAFDRDTASVDGVVWDCHGGSPAGELQRRWETIARRDGDGRHIALGVLLTAWQGGRGGYDCEPLLRTFGRSGATWGAYLEYALGGGS
jgi:hypothetical protein